MILITGATGFLGRNLIPRLLREGYTLRALVRPSSDTTFLQTQQVELAYADDISDATAVRAACQGCDQVIHAAALFRFWGEEAEFERVNVEGTTAVLQAAIAANVSRFVHISTAVVIGNTAGLAEIDENSPRNPLDPYQRSKLKAEQAALRACQEQELPVVVLRPGAFYGPWGRYAFNRLFFEEPLKGWRIKVNNGRYITFPAYVADVAQAVLLALTNGRAGEIYNICSQTLTHNAANKIISDLAAIGRWRVPVPEWVALGLARGLTAVSHFTRREPFYPTNMAPYVFQNWNVSAQKAKTELGFLPTPFEEGAKATLDWYREQGLLGRDREIRD